MLINPSPVLNAPDGLAVMLSLPIGWGSCPATRKLETTQPIVAMAASSIETSMNTPSLRLRSAKDAAIANAAVIPPTVSAMGYPTRSGADSPSRSEEHTSELQSRENLVCRLLLE